MRTTLDDAGAVLAAANYDPWGTPQGDTPGQVTVICKMTVTWTQWYTPGWDTFTARDPFAGWAETPYSLHT